MLGSILVDFYMDPQGPKMELGAALRSVKVYDELCSSTKIYLYFGDSIAGEPVEFWNAISRDYPEVLTSLLELEF